MRVEFVYWYVPPFLLWQQASPDVKIDHCGFPKHLKPQIRPATLHYRGQSWCQSWWNHDHGCDHRWQILEIMIMVVIIENTYWVTAVSDMAHLLQPTFQLERFILPKCHSMGSRNGQSRLMNHTDYHQPANYPRQRWKLIQKEIQTERQINWNYK